MRRSIDVFRIPGDGGPPLPEPAIEVDAGDVDALAAAARGELTRRYRRVRTVSFTPAGMVAYVEGGSR
jgi:hypothetical protein